MEYNDRLELFENNIDLAKNIANKHWSHQQLDIDDMQQEALMALWQATDTYDPAKGAFTTYATHCITGRLHRAGLRQKYGAIGPATNFIQAMSVVKKHLDTGIPIDKILAKNKYPPSVKEYTIFLYHNNHDFASIDEKLYQDDDPMTLHDMLASNEDMETNILNKMAYDHLKTIIDVNFYQIYMRRSYRAHNPKRYEHLLDRFMQWIFEEQTPYAIIAAELGMSRGAVRNQFYRWMKIVRRIVTEKWLNPRPDSHWEYIGI